MRWFYLILFSSIVLVVFNFFTPVAFAAETIGVCESGSEGAPWWCLNVNDLGGLIGSVINLVFILAVILSFAFLVFGGIKWITSGGDKGGVEGARNTIIAAIIGLIVTFLAYLIVNFVVYFLTGTDLSGIRIPTIGCGQAGQPGCQIGDTADYICSDGSAPIPPVGPGGNPTDGPWICN